VEKAGGGTVLVPPPGIYLIAPINLTSNIDFHIESGARIVGVMDHTLWPIIPGAPSYGQGRNYGAHSPRFTSLLHGEHLVNVTIRGDGDGSVLDGQGAYWWARGHGTKLALGATRGHLIELMYTTNIVVRDLRMVDSPFWNNHLLDCEDVLYERVTIEAPPNAPNTDGWDPDSTRNMVIQDSTYTGGDDCILVEGGSREGANPSCPAGWKPPALSVMSNYSFLNIDGRFMKAKKSVYQFTGQADAPITGIRIENVTFAKGRRDPQWLCASVEGTATAVAPSPPCKEITLTEASAAGGV